MTIVVGDLHGKLEIAEKVLSRFRDERIIFVGDYLDSFDRTTEAHIQLLELLLDVQEHRDVITLMGNHELSYLMPETQVCSGYRFTIQNYLDDNPSLTREMHRKCKTYAWEQGWLITHAGVSANWLPVSPSALPECLDTLPCTEHLYDIGRARGGFAKVGGPFWCDYYTEFKPIKGVKQIFGHTAIHPVTTQKGIVSNGYNYNIDCLDHYAHVIKIDNEEVKICAL